LFYSEYGSAGNYISRVEIRPSAWIRFDSITPAPKRIFEDLRSQEIGVVEMKQPDSSYKVTPYRKFLHILNPHSWGPISINATSQTVKPGVSLMSQNKLSTLFTTLGWEYDINRRTGNWYADLSFRGWYPIFDFRFDYGPRRGITQDSIEITYKETSFRLMARLPLNLSSGKWIRWLQPAVASTYYLVNDLMNYPDDAFRGHIRSLDYSLFWSNEVLSTAKDIYPRWGQTLVLNYRHTPLGGYDLGDIKAVRTEFYFPGIGRHHNFFCKASWQQTTGGDFRFSDIISYPRGIVDALDDELLSASVNYTLPLAYPDFSIGPVIYMKRLWCTLFYDHTWGWNTRFADNLYQTVGLELYTDVHIFRFMAPFSLGGRLSYNFRSGTLIPEFIYSLNIAGIQ
jgi:hypothetical protein